jgi:hypothetical protein
VSSAASTTGARLAVVVGRRRLAPALDAVVLDAHERVGMSAARAVGDAELERGLDIERFVHETQRSLLRSAG